MNEKIYKAFFKNKYKTTDCIVKNSNGIYKIIIDDFEFYGEDFDYLKIDNYVSNRTLFDISPNNILYNFELKVSIKYVLKSKYDENINQDVLVEIYFKIGDINDDLSKEIYLVSKEKTIKLDDVQEYIFQPSIQKNLKGNYIKSCSNCIYASYSPFSSSSYLMCFKYNKEYFKKINGYQGLRDIKILNELKYDVINELFLCDEFEVSKDI